MSRKPVTERALALNLHILDDACECVIDVEMAITKTMMIYGEQSFQ